MKFTEHKLTKAGYCRRCRSKNCNRTKYIPRYDHIWTWEERYAHFMQGASDYTVLCLQKDFLEYQRRKLREKQKGE